MSMSSRKAAAKVVRRGPARSTWAKPDKPAAHSATHQASQLAEELLRAAGGEKHDVMSVEALQALMAALCRVCAANISGENAFPSLAPRAATGAEVMIAVDALQESADLAVFELGVSQSWSGR